METAPTLLGTREAARILGVHHSTVRRLVSRGVLEASRKMPGRTGGFVFTPEQIEAARSRQAETFEPSPAPAYGDVTA